MEQRQSNIPFPAIFPVTSHTDHVGIGTIFVVIKGFKADGLLFVPRALERGASSIVIEHDMVINAELQELIDCKGAHILRAADTRKALAELSAQAASYPAQKMKIIGITGTKGKTTTSFLLKHMLSVAGYRTALLSTAGNYIEDQLFSATLTTAQPDYLHQFLKLCVGSNITHVVIEVAAQALTLQRIAGIVFDAIIFTNFGLEHLEFYSDMDSYFSAKCQLFDQRLASAIAYVNTDDEWCGLLAQKYERVRTFGTAVHADICMVGTHSGVALKSVDTTCLQDGIDIVGLQFSLQIKGTIFGFKCPVLSGMYNAYNIVAGICVLLDLGVSPDVINQALMSFAGVPGRFERHALSNGALAIIDYAHNPLSYQALLPELRLLTDHLIVIFGAGGERDASRRPLMGLVAVHYADLVVLTSDNPRSEDPQKIVADIAADIPEGLRHKIIIELDRGQAIKKAFSLSGKTTVIALLGKGPDRYQIVGSCKTGFYEAEILASL